MPALHSLNLNSTHADGQGFASIGSSVNQLINVPSNAETLALSATTAVDLHEDITLTSGFIAFIGPYQSSDLPGTGNTFTNLLSQIYTGTGSAEALSFSCINVHAGATNDPTAGGTFGYATVFKSVDLKHSATGF